MSPHVKGELGNRAKSNLYIQGEENRQSRLPNKMVEGTHDEFQEIGKTFKPETETSRPKILPRARVGSQAWRSSTFRFKINIQKSPLDCMYLDVGGFRCKPRRAIKSRRFFIAQKTKDRNAK